MPVLRTEPEHAPLRAMGRGSLVLLVLLAVSGCVRSAPMPPEGHVFLTIIVQEAGGTGVVQDCLVTLEPLLTESPSPAAFSGKSDQDGKVKFVQPNGNYEMLTECPGEEPADPVMVDIVSPAITYAMRGALSGRP